MITARHEGEPGTLKAIDLPIAAAATVYCAWLLYAAGPKYLLLSALLYAPGSLVYVLAKREQRRQLFTPLEWALCGGLWLLAVLAGWRLSNGSLSL